MDYPELKKSHPELFDNENALIEIILDEQEIQDWQRERIKKLQSEGKPAAWADIGVVLEDPYIVGVRDLVRFPGGWRNGYIRLLNQADLKGGRGTVILPVFEGKILLLQQYRHPTRKWHYEVPRGFGEPHTSPEANAAKEIAEETGGTIERLEDLGEFYNNTGIEGGAVSLFYAKLATVGEPNLEEGIQSFVMVEIAEFEQWIIEGRIDDGFTIVAFTKAKLRKLI